MKKQISKKKLMKMFINFTDKDCDKVHKTIDKLLGSE